MQKDNAPINNPSITAFLAIGLVTVLGSCAIATKDTVSAAPTPTSLASEIEAEIARAGDVQTFPAPMADEGAPPPPHEPQTQLYPGSGVFIDSIQAAPRLPEAERNGDITLNFEAADLREVVKFILGDLLNENYLVDPRVQGQVTLQTSRPLAREALIPTLESVLRINGVVLVREEGLYKVMPLEGALRGTLSPHLASGAAVPSGYAVRIVPLRYIAAQEMQKILEPFVPAGGLVRVDVARNLLLLAGTAQELARLQDTVDIFDVNWLEGMSVGLFRLRSVEVNSVVAEMERIFSEGSQNPLAGMFRFVPLERLDSVIVITPQAEYLEQARTWLDRLDRVDERDTAQRLYVYAVQNSNAEHLAELLNQVYQDAARPQRPEPGDPQLAPGLQPVEIRSPAGEAEEAAPPEAAPLPATLMTNPTANGGNALDAIEARIIPDTRNNALLIMTTADNYENILSSLQKLDISPRQVLVEATIAEVTLADDLQYGLQWFFKNNNVLGNYLGTGSLLQEPRSARIPIPPVLDAGFTYAISDTAGVVRAVLSTLARQSKVRILSSPQLMVVDNQAARIRVGDQQPVETSVIVTDGGVVTRSIQFRDTGVTLEVIPHVNAGGLVTMEISQEVTDVGGIDEATGQRSFLQRAINSTVVVQSGEAIVLGGLIRDSTSESQSGVPGLYKLPIIGPLFGSTQDSARRTELIVMITPQVVHNSREAQQVTNDLRQRMRGIAPLINGDVSPSDGHRQPSGG